MDAEEDELKYIFEAWSLNCGKKKSSSLTVEKVKPEFSNMKWYSVKDPDDENSKEEEVTKIDVKKQVKLTSDVKNIKDEDTVKIKIYKEGYTNENEFITEDIIKIKDSKVEYIWKKVEYNEKEINEEGYTDIKYVFVIDAYKFKVKSSNSPALELCLSIHTFLIDKFTQEILKNTDYELQLPDGSTKNGKTDDNGLVEEKELRVGHYSIIPKK